MEFHRNGLIFNVVLFSPTRRIRIFAINTATGDIYDSLIRIEHHPLYENIHNLYNVIIAAFDDKTPGYKLHVNCSEELVKLIIFVNCYTFVDELCLRFTICNETTMNELYFTRESSAASNYLQTFIEMEEDILYLQMQSDRLTKLQQSRNLGIFVTNLILALFHKG